MANNRTPGRYVSKNPITLHARHVLRPYGLTRECYETLLEQQAHGCAICKRPPYFLRRDSAMPMLVVDHCHKTGKVRGLLCQPCNLVIGKLETGRIVRSRDPQPYHLYLAAWVSTALYPLIEEEMKRGRVWGKKRSA